MIKLFMEGGEVNVEFHSFSGGERNVKIKGLYETASEHGYKNYVVLANLTSTEDIMDLLLLKDALDRHTNTSLRDSKSTLLLPYVPYARQDRPMAVGEALGAKVMANLINELKFHQVLVSDVHSSVTTALLDRTIDVPQYRIVEHHFKSLRIDIGQYVLCAPDGGALKKVYDLAEHLGGADIVVGQKHRDTKTGKITGTSFSGLDVKGRKVLMVDDICDGGATFTHLGKALKDAGASQVDLFVTHGIFSKGIDDVFDGIVDNVYTLLPWAKHIEGKNEKGILKLLDSDPLFQ